MTAARAAAEQVKSYERQIDDANASGLTPVVFLIADRC